MLVRKITTEKRFVIQNLAEIEARFDENEQEMLCALKTVVMEPEKDNVDAEVTKVCDFYGVKEGRLLSERKILASLIEQGESKFSNDALSSTPKLLHWLHEDGIIKILPCFSDPAKTFGAIPATSCSAERSFSTLRRMKSYLRASMGQPRILDIAILNIEREITNVIMKNNITNIINDFANHSHDRARFLLV